MSRIKPEEQFKKIDRPADGAVAMPNDKSAEAIPEAAKKISFVLKSVNVLGATAFSAQDLQEIYSEYIDKTITLDVIYAVANSITARYREAGYFLSRAIVPAQEINNGQVTIKIVEGFVGVVDNPDDLNHSSIIQNAIADLISQRPLSLQAMERFLLLLDDLPGQSFGGTLSQIEGGEEGAVKLTLSSKKTDRIATISFDNHSSRFLGPNELSASYSASLMHLQQTTLSALSDVDRTKLHYGTIQHSIPLTIDTKIDLSGGLTRATPGFSLESSEIESISKFASFAFDYKWIRQRQQNLSIKAAFDWRNVTSDILGAPLTRDFIRTFRATADYDRTDSWRGYNTASLTLSHGVEWLSSSNPGDANLSRAGALPDFTKGELSLSRLQSLSHDWLVYVAGSGQWASGVLYSSEQFSYGGQGFGRAYDSSDITGDHGVKGAVEFRYSGFADEKMISIQPYAFYDIGKVWNEAAGQPSQQSASSAGAGLRFNTEWQMSGNFGVAFPLDRDITTPIYGVGMRGPRVILQITQQY